MGGTATTIDLATYSKASLSDVSVSATGVSLASATATNAGLVARYTSTSSFYLGQVVKTTSTSGTVYTAKIFRGTTLLASTIITLVNDPTFNAASFDLQFVVQGNALQLFVDGHLLASAVDSTLKGPGLVGIRCLGNAVYGSFAAN